MISDVVLYILLATLNCPYRQESLEMSTCVYEVKMSAKYVELSADEMEYDGGWIVSAIAIAVETGLTVAGKLTNNEAMQHAGTVVTVIGLVSTGVGFVQLATTTPVKTMTNAGLGLMLDKSVGVPALILSNALL